LIEGEQLRGDATLVLIEDQEFPPAAVSDNQITLPLPAAVHAGVKGIQIVQKQAMGTPPLPHRGFESNVAPFVLHPTITGSNALIDPSPPPSTKVTDVTVNLAPNIGKGQRAILILNDNSASPPSAFTSLPTISTADANQVVIKINNVPAGNYLARVQIDGAESLLTVVSNLFTGPMVNMP